ncbi:unnamed protein product [Schistocephalus solidus]|uniref:VPS13_mid_rpt domain-containing protein n=1 Tax=Schistocephalus solidus TaxID=70667 RepID=A0A183SNM3_SCHSO|nr:unnamed protein product [Schistocephalus solidus]
MFQQLRPGVRPSSLINLCWDNFPRPNMLCPLRLTCKLFRSGVLHLLTALLRLILSQTSQSQKSNVISVTFKQDDKENKDVDISVCSMQICASLDYFMLLKNFFVEGAPTKTKPTVQRSELSSRPANAPATPSPNKVEPRKWTMRLHGRIEEPEFVVVEDMSDPHCNAVVLSTSLVLDYSMMEGEDVINASIKDLKVVACPFNRADRADHTMNVVSPTSIFFYARKPLDSFLRGTVNMESLLINVSPSIIQSISKIVSSLSESAGSSVGGAGVGIEADNLSVSHQFHLDDQFWAHKPIDPTDLPSLTSANADQRQSSVASVASSSEGCDVAKLLTEADQRREEKILVHVDYICLLMESQIGAKQMPMLSLEATVDGEIVSPSTCLAASMTVEVAVSYYNDHINEWEQLLETLPQENNRFWSLQLEFTSGDPQDLFSEEEWSNLANMQTANRTLSITSQDNLEITISKTALDVLSKLGAFPVEAEINNQLPFLDVLVHRKTNWDLKRRCLERPPLPSKL